MKAAEARKHLEKEDGVGAATQRAKGCNAYFIEREGKPQQGCDGDKLDDENTPIGARRQSVPIPLIGVDNSMEFFCSWTEKSEDARLTSSQRPLDFEKRVQKKLSEERVNE